MGTEVTGCGLGAFLCRPRLMGGEENDFSG
jgi:hypothetical protein